MEYNEKSKKLIRKQKTSLKEWKFYFFSCSEMADDFQLNFWNFPNKICKIFPESWLTFKILDKSSPLILFSGNKKKPSSNTLQFIESNRSINLKLLTKRQFEWKLWNCWLIMHCNWEAGGDLDFVFGLFRIFYWSKVPVVSIWNLALKTVFFIKYQAPPLLVL